MTKKGQIVSLAIMMMFFMIVFGLWLSAWVRDSANLAVNNGGFQGVEQALLSNFLVFVLLALGVGALYLSYR